MSTLYFNLIAIAAEAITTSKQPAISAYINQTVTSVMLSVGQLIWLQTKYNTAAENKELLNTGIVTILYFIASVVQLAKWTAYFNSYGYGANIAAGVFGLFNFLAYAAGTYFLYLEHKSGATI
uniref:MARVEL domain-containing protein n=1 Tax=Glossina pallidipes TaxID=7398 RepID=A0A1B0A5J1_GLOPL